jgi:hypothetical protein
MFGSGASKRKKGATFSAQIAGGSARRREAALEFEEEHAHVPPPFQWSRISRQSAEHVSAPWTHRLLLLPRRCCCSMSSISSKKDELEEAFDSSSIPETLPASVNV